MVAKSTAPVESHQLKLWRDRLENLESLLETAPSSEWEWLWKIRHRIMTFLLSRYEQEQLIDAGIATELDGNSADSHIEDTEPYSTRHEWTPPNVTEDMGKPLRSNEELRAFLERTHEANEERHNDWEKMRVQMLNEMEEAIRVATKYWSKQRITPCGEVPAGPDDSVGRVFARGLIGSAGFVMIIAMFACAYNLSGEGVPTALTMIVVVMVVGILLLALSVTSWPALIAVDRLRDEPKKERRVVRGVIGILIAIVVMQSALIAVLIMALGGQSPTRISALKNNQDVSKPDYYALGMVERMDGQHELAIKHFTLALERYPDHPDAYWKRADCHLAMAYVYLSRQKLTGLTRHMQAAIQDFRSATDSASANAAQHCQVARVLTHLEKRVVRAASVLGLLGREKWLELSAMIRGEAARHYESAIGKDALHEAPRHALASMMFESKKYDECRRMCSMLLEINQDHVEGRVLRARAAAAMGDDLAALADCQLVLKQHPEHWDAGSLFDEITERTDVPEPRE